MFQASHRNCKSFCISNVTSEIVAREGKFETKKYKYFCQVIKLKNLQQLLKKIVKIRMTMKWKRLVAKYMLRKMMMA